MLANFSFPIRIIMANPSLENLPRPRVKLTGCDGNVFAILGKVARVLREAGWTQEQIAAFHEEATSGDYGKALRTCMEYMDVR